MGCASVTDGERADPAQDLNAIRDARWRITGALRRDLRFIDRAAIFLRRENAWPNALFDICVRGNILRVVLDENPGTLLRGGYVSRKLEARMANEEDVATVLDEGRSSMQKTLERFGKELTKVRTGRASTSILDGINVNYFDTLTPLNQLATLSVPDPRMIVVSPFDKSAISAIEKTIQASDLGLSPSNDGKVIRIQIPSLTEERRKVLVKQVRKIAEDHRIRVRDARRDSLSRLKDLEEDGLSKDDRHRADKKVQEVTDEFVKRIDDQTAQKEKDVLEV